MSTFNASLFIKESIESILNQDYKDFELLIIDDKSDDLTKKYIKSYNDSRIRLIELPTNVGVGAALNFGLSIAKGKYIAKTDADDINHPERFAIQLAALEANSKWGLVKGCVDYFSDDSLVLKTARFKMLKTNREAELNSVNRPETIAQVLQDWCCIAHTTIMAKTEIVRHFGYPPWRMGEDYALFYRMNQTGIIMGMEKGAKVLVRVSPKSTTGCGKNQTQWITNIYALKRERVFNFIGDSRRLCVIGGGQLADGLKRCLAKDGFEVEMVVDYRNGGFQYISSEHECGESDLNGRKVFIACQPVRKKVCQALIRRGLRQNDDYFIFDG